VNQGRVKHSRVKHDMIQKHGSGGLLIKELR
jgi:hypothetical protein